MVVSLSPTMRASCRSLRSAHKLISHSRKYSTPSSSPQLQPVTAPQKTNTASSSDLPAPKLRALVSLYHKTANYVTPETLSARIIHAFSNPRLPETGSLRMQIAYSQLEDQVKDRRQLPHMVEAGVAPNIEMEDVFQNTSDALGPGGAKNDSWSGKRTTREQRVVNALYGVKGPVHTLGPVLPGLEMLEEEAARIEKKNQLHKKTQKNLEWS